MIQQTIDIKKLEILASVGLYEAEKQKPQRIIVNVKIWIKPHRPSKDSFEDIVCYHKIFLAIENLFASGHIHTLEKASYDICDLCFVYSRVEKVLVRLDKPDILPRCEAVGVTLEKTR